MLTVYRPIEEFWESFGPAAAGGVVAVGAGVGDDGAGPEGALDPLDAFLVSRVLELLPGLPILVDAAVAATGGASSLIGLAHPHVRSVVAAAGRGSRAADRAVAALRGYARSRGSALAPLDVIARSELPAALDGEAGVVILVDMRSEDAAALAGDIRLWLEGLPGAVVLLLGLGPVGSGTAIESLLRLCTPGSGRQFWLLRELGEMLAASHLGVVARHDHPHIADVLLRIEQCYTGNYGFLDLLRQVNQAALRTARVDEETLRSHPSSWPLRQELDELRRAAQEAKDQAAEATRALARKALEMEALGRALQRAQERAEARAPLPVRVALRTYRRIRPRLATSPLGGAWRGAKRLRRRLAPTPVGGAWRLGKRVVRKCLPPKS
jgi:hypothetical protein